MLVISELICGIFGVRALFREQYVRRLPRINPQLHGVMGGATKLGIFH
jgi:hypothetical protein